VLWPSPFAADYGLHLGPDGGSHLELPVLPMHATTLEVPTFKAPEPSAAEHAGHHDDPPLWEVVEDRLTGSVTVRTSEFAEDTSADGGRSVYAGERLSMTASDDDPAHARMDNEVVYRLRDGDVDVRIDASGSITSTESAFDMAVELRVRLGDEPFFERSWSESIPRRLV
jgi:hypothetical protein